jgi:HPt (histidine-containing phosphotransfer) domain-containing protein
MKGDRERCLEAGMDDYVSKPLRPEELFDTIESLAEAHAPELCVGLARGNDEAGAACSETTCEAQPFLCAIPACGDERPVFDRAEALNRVGGDDQFLGELIEVFLQEAPLLMRQLGEGIENRDVALVKRAAHTLKGAVGNFGAAAVFDVGQRLENMAQAGDLADAQRSFGELQMLMARLTPELAKAIPQSPTLSTTT